MSSVRRRPSPKPPSSRLPPRRRSSRRAPRGSKRSTYFLDSQTSPGLPQLCVLMVSLSLVAAGGYYLVMAFEGKKEEVVRGFERELEGWESARYELGNSTFRVKYDVDGGRAKGEMDVNLVTGPDRFTHVLDGNGLGGYKNTKFVSGYLPEGTVQLPVFGPSGPPEAASFTIEAVDPRGVSSTLELGSYGLGMLERRHAETPSPRVKCPGRQGGVFNLGTSRCYIYKRLRYVCVQVEPAPGGGGWRLREPEGEPGRFGCASAEGWEPATYFKLKPTVKLAEDGEVVQFEDEGDFDKVQVHLRHGDDPFFYVERETADTLNFGSDASELETLAAVLLAIGSIMSIPPLLMFYNMCCKDDGRGDTAYHPVGMVGAVGEGDLEEEKTTVDWEDEGEGIEMPMR